MILLPGQPVGDERGTATGILLMIAAFAVFALLDAAAKYAGPMLGASMVIFFRYAFALGFIVMAIAGPGNWSAFGTNNLGIQVLRGVLLAIGTSCNFVAIGYLQLAQTSSIMFSNPLWVCALSPFLLGEKVGIRRWSAVIIGFIGVIIIIRPGTGSFHWAMLLSVCVALCSALYQIATRRIGAKDQVVTSLFYSTIAGTIFAAPLASFNWVTPDLFHWGLMIFAGFCGAFGHMMLTQAHRIAPAPTLAPFVYTQIIWMTLIGFWVFGNVPDMFTVLGALVVVASGLYVFWREQQLVGRGL